MNPNVSVIILNWNGWNDTIECLESLYQIDYSNYNVILVDNDSHDDSINKIKEYCEGKIKIKSDFFEYNSNNKPIELIEPIKEEFENKESKKEILSSYSNEKLILIKNNKNHGFAEGNNIGIRYALNNLDSSYILLLNNDTVVDEHFLDELVKVAESDEKIGFVGSKTYYYGKKNVIQIAGGGEVDLKHGIPLRTLLSETDNAQYDQCAEVDYISGSCLLCKKGVIDQIGILDSVYFMYWEDADWCFRGREIGYKSVYAFRSKIWHKVGTSSESHHKIYYHYRNRIYFMRKSNNTSQYIKFLLQLFIFTFWQESMDFLYAKDFKKYISYCRGMFSGFKLS